MGNRWENNGNRDFIFLVSKITADGYCSHKIKRFLLLGRKAMTNLDRILKSWDITLPTKVCLIKAMVFPVVMCRCENWSIKKAEHQRIDAFELWCWSRLLRVLWTAKRSNKSILKKISPEYSLEGLKLKLQYFGHLMWRTDSSEKALILGKIEGRRRRRRQRMRWLDVISYSVDMSLSKLGVGEGHEGLACYSPWGCKESDTTQRLNWLNWKSIFESFAKFKVIPCTFLVIILSQQRNSSEEACWNSNHPRAILK